MTQSGQVTCPGCGKIYPIRADMAGRLFRCKACGTEFRAGTPAAAPTAPQDIPMANMAPPPVAPPPPAIAAQPFGGYVPTGARRSPPGSGYSTSTSTSGMAIASFICGLLFCIPFASLLAIIFGAIGIRRTRDENVGGRGFAIAGLVLGSASLAFMVIFGISVAIPAFSRARDFANRVKCAADMRMIGQATITYANSHGGQFPDSLPTLMNSSTLPPTMFVCPSSNNTPAPGSTPQQQAAGLSTAAGHLSYIYIAAGLNANTAPPRTVLMYEPIADHKDGMNVVLADGSVQFVNNPQASQMVSQIESRTGAQARTPFVAPANLAPTFPGLPPMPTTPPTARSSPRGPYSPPVMLDRQKLVGTWTTDETAIEVGQSGPGTLELSDDGNFVLHSDPPKGPVDITGNWNVSSSVLRLRATRSSVGSVHTLSWRCEKQTGDTLEFRVRNNVETWKKQ